MWVINVTFFSTTFCFSVYFRIKRKISKNHILGEKPRKNVFFVGKNENFYTQGVKTCKKNQQEKKKFWPHQNYLLLLLDTYLLFHVKFINQNICNY